MPISTLIKHHSICSVSPNLNPPCPLLKTSRTTQKDLHHMSSGTFQNPFIADWKTLTSEEEIKVEQFQEHLGKK